MSNVALHDIRKRFGRDNDATRAINGLDLQIEDGEFFVLLGPSGCGKTTTLRCIAGLEQPDSGRIAIGERVVDAPAEALFVPPERRDIGMVFQSYALWPHMTLRQNVEYPLRARVRRPGPAQRAQVEEALALVGLAGQADRYPAALSGGQQQRVALARALVARPRLLLLDEPLSNLDAQLRVKLRLDLRRIQRETGHTAIHVTHDQAEALALADRIAVMRQGRLEQIGPPSEIFLAPATRFVAEFVGFDNIVAGRVEAAPGDGTALALRADVPGLAPIAGVRIRGLHAGDAAQIAIRSSALSVAPAGRGGAAGALLGRGLLREVTYTGEHYLGQVQVGDTTLLGTLPLALWGAGAERDASLRGQPVDLALDATGAAAFR